MAEENQNPADEQQRLAARPESPRSPRSERQGGEDEGSMEPGKGEPHESEEEDEEEERGVKFTASAFNQNDGKGELSQQREVLPGQGQLGFPGNQPK